MIIDQISKETGIDYATLEAVIRTASYRYKTYFIPKRTTGMREINHPTPELKFLQRWIVRNYIVYLPVHPSVMSYKKGIGVARNAKIHAANNFLLRMDLDAFFPSITGEDVKRLLLTYRDRHPFSNISHNDLSTIVKIACRNNVLTIGAPSSPAISNALLSKFDTFITQECTARHIIYSRYADDISFSTNEPNTLSQIHTVVESYLHDLASPRLRINERKTIFTSRKRKRVVTGVILTSDKKLSVGRKKKREIKTLCYLYQEGSLPVDKASYLSGYLAYVKSVEPALVTSLNKKFGAKLIRNIMKLTPVTRK